MMYLRLEWDQKRKNVGSDSEYLLNMETREFPNRLKIRSKKKKSKKVEGWSDP